MWVPSLSCAALLVLSACHAEVVDAAPSATATHAAAPAGERNDDCWYYELESRRLVAVWISPRLPGQVPGGFRFVNLVYHDPDADRQMFLHSSPVRSRGRDVVLLDNGGLTMRAVPGGDRCWGDVVTREHVTVDVRAR